MKLLRSSDKPVTEIEEAVMGSIEQVRDAVTAANTRLWAPAASLPEKYRPARFQRLVNEPLCQICDQPSGALTQGEDGRWRCSAHDPNPLIEVIEE